MDTIPFTGNDTDFEGDVDDSITFSTSVACVLPLTTSTPQKKECGAACLPEEVIDDTSLDEGNDDATAKLHTSIIESEPGPDVDVPCSSKTILETVPTVVSDESQRTYQSKLARALLKTIGYYPELDTLDQLKAAGTTATNNYTALKQFFRRKLLLVHTKLKIEMIHLEKGKHKKTTAYAKLSKELQNATVLLTHLA
jgi:hypothetical protein